MKDLFSYDSPNKMTGGTECKKAHFDKSGAFLKNQYFKGIFDYGFPYNMETKQESIIGFLSNWFSNNVKQSNILLRKVIKTIINVSGSICGNGSLAELAQFILGPIILLLTTGIVSTIWWLVTIISMFVYETQGIWGYIFTICGLFFGWSWIFATVLSFIQIFTVMFKTKLLPILLNLGDIKKILKEFNNGFYLAVVFCVLVLMSAFANLNSAISIGMLISYIFILFKVYKSRKSSNVTSLEKNK